MMSAHFALTLTWAASICQVTQTDLIDSSHTVSRPRQKQKIE